MLRQVIARVSGIGCAAVLAACATADPGTASPAEQQLRDMKLRQEKLEARISDLDTRLAQLADKVDKAVPRPPPDLQVIRLPAAPGDAEGSDVGEMDPDEGGPQGLQDDGSPPVVIKLGPSKSDGEINALYDKARARFQAGDFAVASSLFEEIVRQAPRHDLADNSVYWHGVCRGELGEHLRAIDVLQQLPVKYPKSDKVPDALLKIAESYRALNDRVSSRAYCNQVIEQYPKAEAATKATQLLAALAAGEGGKH